VVLVLDRLGGCLRSERRIAELTERGQGERVVLE
jgi:hypothetical protein